MSSSSGQVGRFAMDTASSNSQELWQAQDRLQRSVFSKTLLIGQMRRKLDNSLRLLSEMETKARMESNITASFSANLEGHDRDLLQRQIAQRQQNEQNHLRSVINSIELQFSQIGAQLQTDQEALDRLSSQMGNIQSEHNSVAEAMQYSDGQGQPSSSSSSLIAGQEFDAESAQGTEEDGEGSADTQFNSDSEELSLQHTHPAEVGRQEDQPEQRQEHEHGHERQQDQIQELELEQHQILTPSSTTAEPVEDSAETHREENESGEHENLQHEMRSVEDESPVEDVGMEPLSSVETEVTQAKEEDAREEEEEENCPICLDVIEKDMGDRLALPCAHLFHGECIKEWLRRRPRCPLCQITVKRT